MSTTTEITPKAIKALIADNRLEDAVAQFIAYTEQNGLAGLHNQLIIQSGKLQQYLRERNLGATDYADLARTRVNISLALLDLANQVPEEAQSAASGKLPGISERALKQQVLFLLAVGKVLLFVYIFTLWESGGLTFEGFLGTMGIVFPVFATYLSMAYQDMLLHRHDYKANDKLRVSRSVQLSAFFFFALYYLAIFIVLYLNTVGSIPDSGKQGDSNVPSYKNLFAMLALVESFIGVYIGKLIFSLFKKEA
ncbi:MAG: hypothetical protein KDD10_23620 [Phaeodactylibacter sp.]|nr:hypothetical protein [Phaeodactylibacter sp.]